MDTKTEEKDLCFECQTPLKKYPQQPNTHYDTYYCHSCRASYFKVVDPKERAKRVQLLGIERADTLLKSNLTNIIYCPLYPSFKNNNA